MPTSSSAIVLGKRYRLGPLLGQGASGAVYEALDLMLGRQIAIKCMKLPAGEDVSARASEFVNEAQTLARLDHPHIVDIHDAGVDESGRPYFVMALVDRTLRDVLNERRVLGLEEVLALFLPLCGALACAHDLGIIHCDLKPENIAVHRVGGAGLRGKLLDFSIARRSGSDSPGAFVVGTPGYMAPEQIQGGSCGPAADVWALAAVAFECLSGRRPFEDDAALARGGAAPIDESLLLKRTVNEVPPSLAEFAPAVAVPMVLAIDRALARSPERRYADMRAFAHALVSAAAQAMVRVPDDPDPIGLPDMQRWRMEGLVTTAKVLVAAPSVPTVSRSHPAPNTSAAPNTEARSSEPRARRAKSRRGLLSVSAVAAFAFGALWLTARSSVRSRADGARTATARERDVPALPTVHAGGSGLAPALLPLAAMQPEAARVTGQAETSLVGAPVEEPPVEEPPASTLPTLDAELVPASAATAQQTRSLGTGFHRGATRPVGSAHERKNGAASDVSSSKRVRYTGAHQLPAALRSLTEEPRAPTQAPVAVDLELKRDWEW